MAKLYSKIRQIVKAVRWLGTEESVVECLALVGQGNFTLGGPARFDVIKVHAPTGKKVQATWNADPGDWIIKDNDDVLSVMIDGVFQKLFDRLDTIKE